uniref:Uncharacterized protein n=1 Tax=Amphimedon queenslandica TaxID=400682 RepID=A0A1X7VUS1_AMPQE
MKLIFLTASVLFLITLTKASELEGFEDFEERNDIDQSEADDALAPKAAATSLCSIDMKALNAVINKAIDSKFQNQPGMGNESDFQLWTDVARNLNIQKINGGTLQAEGKILEKIAIGSGTAAKNGAYLAYRPKYNADHKTGLAGGHIYKPREAIPMCQVSDSSYMQQVHI